LSALVLVVLAPPVARAARPANSSLVLVALVAVVLVREYVLMQPHLYYMPLLQAN
jgi:hypothetical protein